MEALLSVIEVAHSVDSMDLSCLRRLSNIDEARQTIELLLDAYNSHSGTPREALQKQCVLRCLAELLEGVQTRAMSPSSTSISSRSECLYGPLWQQHLQHHHHHLRSSEEESTASPLDAAWTFTADDHLLLSMFLNETATTTDARAFGFWSRAAVFVFPLATALAYPMTSSAASGSTAAAALASTGHEEEAETTRTSLESELHSLRAIIATRFTTVVEALRTVTAYEDARRCHQKGVWALLGCLGHPTAGARVAEELEGALEGLLQPLHRTLQAQLTAAAGRGGAVGGVSSTTSRANSALLLTALLHDVEDVLWAVPHVLSTHKAACAAAPASRSLEQLCARVASCAVEALLRFAQQYIAHRQQRQMESMEEDSSAGGASAAAGDRLGGRRGRGRGGASSRAAQDIFRIYHVQRGVQRVLSVALQLRQQQQLLLGVAPKGGDVPLVSDAAVGGLQAAASAFGGVVTVTDPFSIVPPANVVDGDAPYCMDGDASVAEAAATACASWSTAASNTEEGQLRDCRVVLVPPHHLTTGGISSGGGGAANGGADGDFDFFNEEEAAATLLGRREAYLKTSLGPVTASALVDMVMLTVAKMDFMSEDAIQEQHRRGLEEMQLVAAYQAQREEVEKLRLMERQGVEAIAPGKLMEHVKDSVALQTRGMQLLRRVSARARLERAAFSSVLSSYAHVRGEAEARVRQTQGLIARCLVQLPPSLADSAMDELFLGLRKELGRARAQKEQAEASGNTNAAGGGANAGLALLFHDHSYYQLTLQVLFMYYATQAPIEDRSGMLNSALLLGGGATNNTAEEENEEGLLLSGGGAVLRTETGLSIEVDSPIAFLYDDDVHRASHDVGQKRPREEGGEGGAGEEEVPSTAALGAAMATTERTFGFLNDTVAAPSTYSHVLCRVLELILSARLNSVLVDVLLQAPVLTRYVWHHLYKDFCLSADRTRCVIGMGLVRALAVLRPVYRTCAVNILLQLSLSTHAYARRLAITAIDALLSATTPQGGPLLDTTAEAHIVRYAKKQLFAIPAYQRSAGSKLKRSHEEAEDTQGATTAEAGAATAAAGASGGADEASAKDRARMSTVLERHLGLFLMLCARQPRDLFPALLEVFQQCVDRENITMMQLLPENVDVRRMTQDLFRAEPSHFVSAVLPLLRRRCKEARPLVQAMLWAVRDQLGTMAREATAAAAAIANASDGINAGRQAAAAAALDDLRSISTAVVGHAKAMYELSGIPLGDSATSHSLPDIRYVAPFLGFLSGKELRQTYLKSFLLFVQVQLQFQRRYHGAFHRLPAKERTYVLEVSELRSFQVQVLREVFVKCPVAFRDGVARGLTLVNFFVFLHRAPQESQARSAAALLPHTMHGGGSAEAAVGGVLDSVQDGSGPSAAHAAAAQRDKAEMLPPISVGTTKEVVSLCLSLTRSFDNTTAERLYGAAEVQTALQHLMNPPPVPSQLMATVLEAADLFMRTRNVEFLKFVVQTVLTPLERASVWDADPTLWKGVILFAERYYRECSNFLVNLPDQVLTQALRERPSLCDLFKKEHGNNASFGHILGNL